MEGAYRQGRCIMNEWSIFTHHHIALTVIKQICAKICITYAYLQSQKLQMQVYM